LSSELSRTEVGLEAMQAEFMDYPIEVSIETQAVCNARCTFCPYPTIDRKGEKMPDELLNKLVDEMVSWDREVYFSPFKLSEPLLDKRMLPLCERVNNESDKIVLRIFSNGSALTPKNIEGLAKLKRVAQLWVSLNEHRPEEYEKLMGLKFEHTAKNLDYLHEQPFPHAVMLSTVGFPNEDFRRYCYERWPRFESMAIKKDAWLGFTDAQVTTIPDTSCSRWFELSVTARGTVSHCCMHDGVDTAYNIGDVNTQTLYEVYNAPRWRERREGLVSRKTLDSSTSPCSTCTY
jgi:sulfatase maturation enzyme AslB (radical SAM superfamily)